MSALWALFAEPRGLRSCFANVNGISKTVVGDICNSAAELTLLNALRPRTGLLCLSPFVAMCCPPIEVAFAAWQVRANVWPNPTVNDLHVLDLAKAAISVMAIISQLHMLCNLASLLSFFFYPSLPVPLNLSPALSASSYCIIFVIKRQPVEEDTWI